MNDYFKPGGHGGLIYVVARLERPRIPRAMLSKTRLSERFIARALDASLRASEPPATAWRGERPSIGLDANLPYLTHETPPHVLEGRPRSIAGQGWLKRARLYGAMRRELLLWGGIVLVEVSWTRLFSASQSASHAEPRDSLERARSSWKALSRYGAALQLNKRGAAAPASYQAMLLSGDEDQIQSGPESESDIRFRRFRDFTGRAVHAQPDKTLRRAERAENRGSYSALAYVGEAAGTSGMRVEPVKLRTSPAASDAASIAVGVETPEGVLTATRMAGLARAFSHVIAHEMLVEQAARLARDFAAPMVDAPDWTLKQNAAGRFLMNWQQFVNLFQVEWALGSGDPYAPLQDVQAFDRAMGTTQAWHAALGSIGALATLAAEVLPDGDSSALL